MVHTETRVTDTRGVTPVVGVILLVGVTVVLALSVGAVLTTPDLRETPSASLSLAVDSADDRIALTHEGGDTLDVSALNVTIEIDGTALAEQPPVPFFAANGFESGPTGPFNSRSPDEWQAGETAGVRLADTNAPTLVDGSEVSVLVTADGAVVHQETVTA
jgi:flagellin-like protein